MQKQSFELISRMSDLVTCYSLCYNGRESKFSFFFNLRRRVTNILKAHPSIKVIHFNDGVMAQFGLHLCNLQGIKTSATFHGLDVVFPNYLFRKMLFPIFHKLDQIICVSHYTAAESIRLGLTANRIVVINNGVDHDINNSSPSAESLRSFKNKLEGYCKSKKIILSVGRAVKRKGFSWFIKNVLNSLNDDFFYIIVGPLEKGRSWLSSIYKYIPKSMRRDIDLFLGRANDSAELIKLSKDSRANKKFAHLGALPFDQLSFLMGRADMMIMPNIKVDGDAEGFGLVALEANLNNTFVLASRIEGITDAVIHNKNGYCLESGNAEEWISTINEIQNLKELGERSKVFTTSNFSWSKMTKEYYKAFSSLART